MYRPIKAFALGCVLLSLGAAAPAWAIPITLSFTATFPGGGSISGSFDYNAASVTSNTITSLNSVDLTIDGHTYTVDELGTEPGLIGTTLDGVGVVDSGDDDFFIGFDAPSDTPNGFYYTTVVPADAGVTYSFSQFSITADTTAVPEPGSWPIFLTGVAGIGFLVTQRRRPRQLR